MPRKMALKGEIEEELEILRAKLIVDCGPGRHLFSAKEEACLRMAIDTLSWVLNGDAVMSPVELVEPEE